MLKLRRSLDGVVLPFSVHYHALFKEHRIRTGALRNFSSLERIPFSAKEDLLKNARDFVVTPDARVLARRPGNILAALLRGRETVREEFEREFRPLLMTSTTGRAAQPAPFVYTAHDIRTLSLAGARVMRICGARRDMRMLNMFPFAPHLAFWQTHYAGMEFGVFMVSTGGGKALGTDGNLRLMRKIEPDALIGMPTFLYHILSAAVDEGMRCPKLSKIVLGGEKAPLGMRRRLRALGRELGAEARGRAANLRIHRGKDGMDAMPLRPTRRQQRLSSQPGPRHRRSHRPGHRSAGSGWRARRGRLDADRGPRKRRPSLPDRRSGQRRPCVRQMPSLRPEHAAPHRRNLAHLRNKGDAPR